MNELRLHAGHLEITLGTPPDGPVSITSVRIGEDGASLVAPHPLVVLFTSNERQAGRMSQGYANSAIGARLRYHDHRSWSDETGTHVEITQHDQVTGLRSVATLSAPPGGAALRTQQEVWNDGRDEVTVVALASASIGLQSSRLGDLVLTSGESGWTNEGRWRERPWSELLPPANLGRLGQDAATRFSRTSHGTWSTGEHHPVGVLSDPGSGMAVAWEIQSAGPWHWEIGQTPIGGYLCVLGPTDREHRFDVRLPVGSRFSAPAVTLAFSDQGRDGAIGALTDARRALRRLRAIDASLPVVYNDFLETLLGDPSAERLGPLIRAAAEVGAEYFCIDAGWFAEVRAGDWWNTVGGWREASGRFTGGLRGLLERIRSLGMVPGMWLEPEVIGAKSELAEQLPEDAFLRRDGVRLRVHDRFHLDFRHPAAREHADAAVAYLVEDLGVGFIKLDYNVNPVAAAASDLLGHVRAHRDWLALVQAHYPDVLFENCGAGAMRADAGILALTHLQSTSDQPDATTSATIVSAAPVGILPEQCGNWAVPAVGETLEQTAFALVNGLAGRLYLSGFLDELAPEQRALVRDAVAVAKAWRSRVARSHPSWPLGLPLWDSPQVALALDCDDEYLLAVWSRGEATRVRLPLPGAARAEQAFPQDMPAWHVTVEPGALLVDVPSGPGARLFAVAKT